MNPRIMKEIKYGYSSKEFDFFQDSGVYNPQEPNNCYLRFKCSDTSLYPGQVHLLQIRWDYGSNERYFYPRNPPNVTFLTPIWHTNISLSGGSICVDVLKNEMWSPMCGLENIYAILMLLMEEQNTSSPFNGDAGKDYETAKKEGDMTLFTVNTSAHYNSKMQKLDQKNIVFRLLNAPEFNKTG